MGLRDTLTNLRKWSKRDKSDPQNEEQTSSAEDLAQQQISQNMPAQSGNPRNTTTGLQSYSQQQRNSGSGPALTIQELALMNLQQRERDENVAKALALKEEELQREIAARAAEAAGTELPRSGMEGEIINGLYRIEKMVAQGGMGQVFLATHLGRDNMPVVLKLLIKQPNKDSTEYNRFIQEMLISGRMRHPNLVKVYDYGILLEGLKPYLVMEFCEGDPLRNVLRQSGCMNVFNAASVIIQACDALAEVHAKDIVHRDLKPENLMVKGDYKAEDNVKILDFGIAHVRSNAAVFKPDEEGLAVGSVGYMSPEQICAQPVDHRTDIYSLGLIFYEAITGHPPFVGGTRRETMAMHVQAKHMPPSAMASLPCPEMIDAIVEKALAKHPDARYQSVRELEDALKLLVERIG
jgi:serine/threonine protein kinase